MNDNIENVGWDLLSYEEKNRLLFHQQKKTLDMFLKRQAISQDQYDKSLHDLIEKMARDNTCPELTEENADE